MMYDLKYVLTVKVRFLALPLLLVCCVNNALNRLSSMARYLVTWRTGLVKTIRYTTAMNPRFLTRGYWLVARASTYHPWGPWIYPGTG